MLPPFTKTLVRSAFMVSMAFMVFTAGCGLEGPVPLPLLHGQGRPQQGELASHNVKLDDVLLDGVVKSRHQPVHLAVHSRLQLLDPVMDVPQLLVNRLVLGALGAHAPRQRNGLEVQPLCLLPGGVDDIPHLAC